MSVEEGLPTSADLADFWFGRAVLHLITACGATGAAADLASGAAPSGFDGAPVDLEPHAFLRRLDAARMVVLTAALAAEAAVNGYVHVHGSSYRSTLERLSPPEKLALAPRLLSGCDPFPPGSRLSQRIVRLFELREQLVRPWPDAGTGGPQLDAAVFERFSAQAAREALETAALAVEALLPLYRHPYGRAAPWALRVVKALSRRADAVAALPVPGVDELAEEAGRLATFPEEMPIGA